jgi:membrane-associated phospholipid phosphatase
MLNIVYKFVGKIKDLLYAIGYFSELLVAIIVCSMIYNDPIDLSVFIVILAISGITNEYLKTIIKQNRPYNSMKFLNTEHFTKKVYGMPSGHSQNVVFSILYLLWTTHNFVPWTAMCTVIGILMFIERWLFHNHTAFQLIIGGIIGAAMAYVVVGLRDALKKYLGIYKVPTPQQNNVENKNSKNKQEKTKEKTDMLQ